MKGFPKKESVLDHTGERSLSRSRMIILSSGTPERKALIRESFQKPRKTTERNVKYISHSSHKELTNVFCTNLNGRASLAS